MNATETPIQLAVHCAWCGRTIKEGKPWPHGSEVRGERSPPALSHGICKNCFARERVVIRELFGRVAARRRPDAEIPFRALPAAFRGQ
jgi:hypothetical protein